MTTFWVSFANGVSITVEADEYDTDDGVLTFHSESDGVTRAVSSFSQSEWRRVECRSTPKPEKSPYEAAAASKVSDLVAKGRVIDFLTRERDYLNAEIERGGLSPSLIDGLGFVQSLLGPLMRNDRAVSLAAEKADAPLVSFGRSYPSASSTKEKVRGFLETVRFNLAAAKAQGELSRGVLDGLKWVRELQDYIDPPVKAADPAAEKAQPAERASNGLHRRFYPLGSDDLTLVVSSFPDGDGHFDVYRRNKATESDDVIGRHSLTAQDVNRLVGLLSGGTRR